MAWHLCISLKLRMGWWSTAASFSGVIVTWPIARTTESWCLNLAPWPYQILARTFLSASCQSLTCQVGIFLGSVSLIFCICISFSKEMLKAVHQISLVRNGEVKGKKTSGQSWRWYSVCLPTLSLAHLTLNQKSTLRHYAIFCRRRVAEQTKIICDYVKSLGWFLFWLHPHFGYSFSYTFSFLILAT